MNNVMAWIKANVITVACGVAILVTMLSFVWPIGSKEKQFRNEIAKGSANYDKLNSFFRCKVQMPGATKAIECPIGKEITEELNREYSQMNDGYRRLQNMITKINRLGYAGDNPHDVISQGLFPVVTDAARFEARNAYLAAFQKLYDSLNAGESPTNEAIARQLSQVDTTFRATAMTEGGHLSEEQEALLTIEKSKTMQSLIARQAEKIRIYAEPVSYNNGTFQGFFHIGQWAREGERPGIADIWEGQIGLWIQSDFIRAINDTNNVMMMIDGQQALAPVTEQPIKRIIRFFITTDYTDVWTADSSSGSDSDDNSDKTYKPPSDEKAFGKSPTGRISNPLYDVREAEIKVIIARKGIPKFLNAINRVNFMTPIINEINDISERDEFSERRYYGKADVVEISLKVECLWIRRWTAGNTDKDAVEEYLATQSDPGFPKSMEDRITFLKRENAYDLGLMPDIIRVRRRLPPRDPDFKIGAEEERLLRGPSDMPTRPLMRPDMGDGRGGDGRGDPRGMR